MNSHRLICGLLTLCCVLAASTYETQKTMRGSADWLTLASGSVYGGVLSTIGETDAAERLLVQGYEGLSKSEEVRPVFVTKAIERLISHHDRSGRSEKVRHFEGLLEGLSGN